MEDIVVANTQDCMHHFADKPKKPRWFLRPFCRKVKQRGFQQTCRGVLKTRYHLEERIVFFCAKTEKETAKGLRRAVAKMSHLGKFTPKSYSGILVYESVVYAPFWKRNI